MSAPSGEPAILSVGTQVVTIVDVRGRDGHVDVPRGAVGTILYAPADATHAYRVRLVDGPELSLRRHELAMLARYQEGALAGGPALGGRLLFDRVILRVVVGSRAYGLDVDGSDVDTRGVYLPPAELQWSLYGVPEQIDDEAAQQTYWELQKLLKLALKANPNVLECLWSPLVEHCTALGRELLALRNAFPSQLVYQTYSGYVASQFRKLQAGLRRAGGPKWKHVMHLLRLMLSGIGVLRTGEVPVQVDAWRERLLAVRRGDVPFADCEAWRGELHREFADAAAGTRLPLRPDYERADTFLRRARRLALGDALP